MNAQELAEKLNGIEYPCDIPKDIAAEAKAGGLVIVFGGGDDLIEFRGAINDEVGAGEVMVDARGLIPDFEVLLNSHHRGAKPHLRDYFAREGGGRAIKAVWDRDGIAWQYETDVPHCTFDVFEDGQVWCRGIVFALADLQPVHN